MAEGHLVRAARFQNDLTPVIEEASHQLEMSSSNIVYDSRPAARDDFQLLSF